MRRKISSAERFFAFLTAIIMIVCSLPCSCLPVYAGEAGGSWTSVKETTSAGIYLSVDVSGGGTAELEVSSGGAVICPVTDGATYVIHSGEDAMVATGAAVTLTYSSDSGYYFVSAKKNGVSLSGGSPYEFEATADAEFVVTFEKYRKFTAAETTNGAVSFNVTNPKKLKKNATVTASVIADLGYCIDSILVNGEEKNISPAAVTYSWEEKATVDKEFKASFRKLYDYYLTYEYTGGVWQAEEGTIATAGAAALPVSEGDKIVFSAPAADGYRLASRKMENVPGMSACSFETIGTEDVPQFNDYILSVSAQPEEGMRISFYYLNADWYDFALPEEPEHGRVYFAEEDVRSCVRVMRNGETSFYVEPDFGYAVESVKIGDADGNLARLTQEITTADALYWGTVTVDAPTAVEVVFAESTPAAVSDVARTDAGLARLISSDSVTTDTCIYTSAGSVSFGSAADRLRIRYVAADGMEYTEDVCSGTALRFTGDVTILQMAVYRDLSWHIVKKNDADYQVEITHDTTTPSAALSLVSEPNASGYYTGDFDVALSTSDAAVSAGIESVIYQVFSGGVETCRETLYARQGEDFADALSFTRTIDASENESPEVRILLTVTDVAGYVSSAEKTVKINTVAPQISLKMTGIENDGYPGYFSSSRTATITIADRDDCFDEDNFTLSLLQMTDASGVTPASIQAPSIIWKTPSGPGIHVGEITFRDDANYMWAFDYVSGSGLPNAAVVTTGASIYQFTIDKLVPTLNIKGTYSDVTIACMELMNTLTFHYYWNTTDLSFSVTDITDETSGVDKPVVFYSTLAFSDTYLTSGELNALYAQGEFSETAPAFTNENYVVVYARVEDKAGNFAYYHTGGIVIDTTASSITLTPRTKAVNEYYTEDFTVDVLVQDQTTPGAVYSGVKNVTYEVLLNYGTEQESVSQSGVLYAFDAAVETTPSAMFTGSVTVNVSNCDTSSAALKLTSCDMAGSCGSTLLTFAINTLTPQASLSFRNEDAAAPSSAFYTAGRTAVLTVTDRAECFDADAFGQALFFAAADSQNVPVSTVSAISIGSWTHSGDTHTIEIAFGENQTDANFRWGLTEYVDKSGLTISAISTEGAYNPWSFTIDRGIPSGKLTVKAADNATVLAQTTALKTADETSLFINPDKLFLAADSSDDISSTSVAYFLATGPSVMTRDELDAVTFTTFSGLTVDTSSQFICYLKISDEAGNYIYVSSDLYINDKDKPVTTLSARDVDGETRSVYKKDVKVSYDISDITDNVASGIKEISYWVGTSSSSKTQEGTLFQATATSPAVYADLMKTSAGSITVDSAKNKAAAVKAHFIVTDFAGNTGEAEKVLDIVYSDYSVTATTGGSVTLNASAVTEARYFKNDTVVVAAAAEPGCYISEVKCNGVSQTVAPGAEVWSCSETASADTAYTVSFAKLYDYCLTYTFSGGNWNVSSTLTGEDLSAVVLPTVTTPAFVAASKDGYRLASRRVGAGDSGFAWIGSAAQPQDKDYTYMGIGQPADGDTVKFYYVSADWYDVTIDGSIEHGCVTFAADGGSTARVMHNGSVDVLVTPDYGYKTALIHAGEVTVPLSSLQQIDITGDVLTFTCNGIDKAQTVVVSFEESSPASVSGVLQSHQHRVRLISAADSSEDVCVYSTEGSVSFDTAADRLKILYTDKNNQTHVVDTISGSAVKFGEDTKIAQLAVYSDLSWHIVKKNSSDYQLSLVYDVTTPSAVIVPVSANQSGYYTADFNVDFSVSDDAVSSGISSVSYAVLCNGAKTAEETLYTDQQNGTVYETCSFTRTISATANESDDVLIQLSVADRAGNICSTQCAVRVNTVAPQISVEVDGVGNTAHPDHFRAARTATITILDRDDCFDRDRVTFSLQKMQDAAGTTCAAVHMPAIVWKEDPQAGCHVGEIVFSDDANYQWSLSYISGSGLDYGTISTSGTAIYAFTVDSTAPTVSLQREYSSTVEACVSLANLLTFRSFWKAEQVKFAGIDDADSTSQMETLQYYTVTTRSSVALTAAELDALFAAGAFSADKPVVDADSYAVVYVRAEDYAGNITYAHTDGIVVDNTASNISILPSREKTGGYYTSDFDVDITVADQLSNGNAFSGVKRVTYEVLLNPADHAGTICQSGVLYDNSTFSDGAPKASWTDTLTIAVNAANNAPSAELIVMAEDFASTTSSAVFAFATNTLTPSANLRFADEEETQPGNCCFARTRKAILTVTDRSECFDGAAFERALTFSAVDYAGTVLSTSASVSVGSWTQPAGQPDTHVLELTFGANENDANYTWQFNGYTDLCGLTIGAIDAAATVFPWAFTVDRVVPDGKLTVKNTSGDAIFAETEKLLSAAEARLFITDSAITISAVSSDVMTATDVKYYLSGRPEIMNKSELDAVGTGENGFKPFAGLSVDTSSRFYAYLKVTDAAGNYKYISSDLYIKDNDAPHTVLTATGKDNQPRTIFNENVTVAYEISDIVNDVYSGVGEIRYWVGTSDDAKTQEAVLYPAAQETVDVSSYDSLMATTGGSIVVDAANNNSSGIQVHFIVTDNAGNVSDTSIVLDIDVTAPVLSVRFRDGGSSGNYNSARSAVVTIEERFDHFDPDRVQISGAGGRSEWTTGASVQTCTLNFPGDAHYRLNITCSDMAGNVGNSYSTSFTVDKTPPTASIKVKTEEEEQKSWSSLVGKELIGLISKSGMTYTISSSDATSGVSSVAYHMVNRKKAGDSVSSLSSSDLSKVTDWESVKDNTITGNRTSAIYLRVRDACGNTTYVGTEGLLIDSQGPEITVTEDQPHDIYSADVPVSIKVAEPVTDASYSGLKSVSYKVFDRKSAAPELPTQEGILFAAESGAVRGEWTGNIVIDSKLNNSNEINVVVYAEDTAGNTTDTSQPEAEGYLVLKIDRTAPSIDVVYDNNSAENETFFRDVRTASVKVTERNFDPEKVALIVTASGDMPAVSAWVNYSNGGNGDNDIHVATIQYAADGDYTFDVTCSDMAGNQSSPTRFAEGTVSGTQFTIDRTPPVVQVSYNNNSAMNGNYFNAARRATISVTDRNFTPSDVNILITARSNGAGVAIPATSQWTSSGDTYTATVDFVSDALYTFDITCKDKAGNVYDAYNPDSFYIDQTPPVLEIGGVLDLSANNGDVIPVITSTDANYDDAPIILLSGVLCGDVTPAGSLQSIAGGQMYTFENFAVTKETDDIYTLYAKTVDKAGNETEGSIRFSVNRFGSVYVLSNDTEVINDRYVRAAGDVVLTEINADALNGIQITLYKSGETIILSEGTDYTVEVSGGDGIWYEYRYKIDRSLFADDGIYRLTIHSQDAAGNVAENTLDTKNAEISFGVDKTLPLINVFNLESGMTYAVENMTAEFSVSDNLVLVSLNAYLDGEPCGSWEGSELAAMISDAGKFTVFIDGNTTDAHTLRLVASDAAGNTAEEIVDGFYVTTDVWTNFYNNKPLFYGSIGGSAVGCGGIVWLISALRKRRLLKLGKIVK